MPFISVLCAFLNALILRAVVFLSNFCSELYGFTGVDTAASIWLVPRKKIKSKRNFKI
jgi:hypothetical protein